MYSKRPRYTQSDRWLALPPRCRPSTSATVANTSPAKTTSFDPAMKHSSMLEMHKFPKVWRRQ